jgi:alanyl-tRNA synthetase
MTSTELRKIFLEFFEKRGHKVIPSASLLPENDPSVLFTTAGMQQFKRYYLFPEEAPSARITTCQKCVRTGDIDEVGDESHLTFFEMLGNFSFGYPKKSGAYFKEETIKFAWEFLTETLKIDKKRIRANYFGGNNDISEDKESLKILKTIPDLKKINATGFDETFWSLGTEGSPGGPTVEFYVDGLEVWNCVFNQYVMRAGKYIESELKGVDTGMGLERLTVVMQGKSDVYETDLFTPIISAIEKISSKKYEENKKAFRIVADHTKAAVMMIADGVELSNKDRGYILRRLIRRAIRYSWLLGNETSLTPIIELIISNNNLSTEKNILEKFQAEEEQFSKIIDNGLRRVEKVFAQKTPISQEEYSKVMQFPNRREILREIHSQEPNDQIHPEFKEVGIKMTNRQMHEAYISGKEAFDLFQTYGLPHEILLDLGQKRHLFISIRDFEAELKKHQEKSRTASAGMFKGGLADNKVETTKLHTAAHLLLAALRQVLSKDVSQKGSNINEERLRFDFNWPEKLTPEQIAEVEKIVNEKISENIPVEMEELSLADAKKSGASGVFDDRYGEKVKVYTIGGFSKEICGGPHVKNTGELGQFKITKEESSSAGIRRIKAVLE